MKTFEDACQLLLRKVRRDETTEEGIKQSEELKTNLDRIKSVLEEVQTHKNTFIIANTIIEFGNETGLCPHQMLGMALSYGVAIGIDMEKQDALAI